MIINRSDSLAKWAAVVLTGAAVSGCGGSDSTPSAPIALAPTVQRSCAELVGTAPSGTVFDKVEAVQGGSFAPAAGEAITGLPDFCRVAATVRPTTDSNIRVEVWMPLNNWNGKYLGTGNGGLAGAIQYAALAAGLKRGFAVANTDMGTSPSVDVMVGVPDKWIDFGYRSTHLMTVLAKQLVDGYYGKAPSYSYFHGCSTGGGQGLHEAQRYPNDYNGIVAGAPGNYRTGVHTDILWNFRATRSTQFLSSAKLTLLKNASVAACDEADGVKDGIISRPDSCHFDPGVLQCSGAQTDSCLTAAQVAGARQIYGGIRNAATGAQYHDGLPPGSELGGWNFGVAPLTASDVPFAQIFQTVFGKGWTSEQFDWAGDLATMDSALGPMVNATSPDLRSFQSAGGKIVLFQGMADGVQPYTMTQKYWDNVDRAMPGEVGKFARLFNAPGMGHCGGGDGPNVFGNDLNNPYAGNPAKDLLSAVEAWVEKGTAPGEILATKFANNTTTQAVQIVRPACAYPQVLKYRGAGDPNAASSFTCSVP